MKTLLLDLTFLYSGLFLNLNFLPTSPPLLYPHLHLHLHIFISASLRSFHQFYYLPNQSNRVFTPFMMSCQPLNTPANPQQVRDALRKKFEKRADYILDELESRSQVSYDCGALYELGILLHHVDLTTDQELPDYKPLSKIEYSKYKINSARVPKHLRHHYDCFDDAFHWPSSLPRPDTELLYERAFQIVTYINILRDYSEKDDSMEENSNWYQIL